MPPYLYHTGCARFGWRLTAKVGMSEKREGGIDGGRKGGRGGGWCATISREGGGAPIPIGWNHPSQPSAGSGICPAQNIRYTVVRALIYSMTVLSPQHAMILSQVLCLLVANILHGCTACVAELFCIAPSLGSRSWRPASVLISYGKPPQALRCIASYNIRVVCGFTYLQSCISRFSTSFSRFVNMTSLFGFFSTKYSDLHPPQNTLPHTDKFKRRKGSCLIYTLGNDA